MLNRECAFRYTYGGEHRPNKKGCAFLAQDLQNLACTSEVYYF